MSFRPNIPLESLLGTTASGNLPMNKRNRDGVDITKAGHCYKLCPYANENPISNNPMKADHPETAGRMRTYSKGRALGWICWDDNCPYYTTVLPGRRYFEC